jgi:hypothetical protein
MSGWWIVIVGLVACREHDGGREHKRDDDRFTPISRNAKILDRTGTPPIPEATQTCLLEVWSREEPDECQAWVTCDGQRVYGSKTSFTKCASTAKGPTTLSDTKPTPVDKDARLEVDLVANTMTLSDTSAAGVSYSIRMHLE